MNRKKLQAPVNKPIVMSKFWMKYLPVSKRLTLKSRIRKNLNQIKKPNVSII